MTLTPEQVRRYARHVLLPDVGGRGQERLLASAVSVPVGPGRAGEVAALLYLAAAGVGTLVVVDEGPGPITEAEQKTGIAYRTTDVGRARIEVLRDRLIAANPDVLVVEDAPDAELLAPIPELEDDTDDVAGALVAGGGAAARTIAQLLRES